MKARTLRVTVDANEPKQDDYLVKGATSPLDALVGMSSKVIDVEVEALSKHIESTYAAVVAAISALPESDGRFVLKDVTFTLSVDSTGGVSLFSVMSGNARALAGLTFKITAEEINDGNH